MYEGRRVKISDLNETKEYALALDDFLNPVTFKGRDAIEILLCRIILLEPGTYETHPYMGVGIVSKYRYMHNIDINTLRDDISNQIATYLPWLYGVEVRTSIPSQGKIRIVIKANDQVFALTYDTSTTTLKRESLSLDAFA